MAYRNWMAGWAGAHHGPLADALWRAPDDGRLADVLADGGAAQGGEEGVGDGARDEGAAADGRRRRCREARGVS